MGAVELRGQPDRQVSCPRLQFADWEEMGTESSTHGK